MDVTKHDNGRFCWAELHTPDGPGAKAFYTALMGWTAVDNPIGPDMVYTMLNLKDKSAAALYEDRSNPPHWGVYISVDDVEAAAARAKELGGAVLNGPFDVMENGRMVVVQDPTGAVFSMWQPQSHIGYTVVGEAGAVGWNELATRNTVAAEAFYSGLFGYGIKHGEMPMPYTEFQLDGNSIAGMMAMGPHMDGIPPHWMVYLTVADCRTAVEKAGQLGAETCVHPTEVPGVGTFAVLRDPQGAVFSIID